MTKVTLSDVANISGAESAAIGVLNANSDLITTAIENTLSRDGTSPNSMAADLDMNNNDILNVDNIDVNTLTIDGVPVAVDSTLVETGSEAGVQGFRYDFNTVPLLLADVVRTYSNTTAGDYIRTRQEGLAYLVAASGASDQHATTAGGLKLYVQPVGGVYSAAAFGVVADGVTVETTKLQTALTAAGDAGGGIVQLPKGTTVSGSLTLPEKVTLSGIAADVSVLQLDGNPTNMITCAGSLDSNVTLSANALKGATTLTVASTTGLAAGDYIVLTDDFSYTTTNAAYKSGEMCRVYSVDSGTGLTLYSALMGSRATSGTYTTANTAKINKVTTVTAPCVRDMTIIGVWTSTTNLIRFTYALGGEVTGVKIKDHGCIGIRIEGCIDTKVYDNSVDNLRDDIGSGFSGYGVSVSGPSDGVHIHNNYLTRCRHGITTMGGATGFPHRIHITDNLTIDTSQSGIDTHDAGDQIFIHDNAVYASDGSGITVRTKGTEVKGNRVINAGSHGIACSEENASDVTISGNYIIGAYDHGISCAVSCLNLVISRNEIINSGQDGITLFGSGTVDSTGLVVRDNYIKTVGLVGTNRAGIITTGAVNSTGAIIEGNTVDATAGSCSYGIRTLFLTTSAVVNNKGKGTFGTSMYDLAANVAIGNIPLDVSINQIQLDPTTSAIRAISSGSNADILLIPKGTGVVRFATWTANADAAVNGYITIKDVGGTTRKLATIA